MNIVEVVVQSVSDYVSPWFSCEFTLELAKLQGWFLVVCVGAAITSAAFSAREGTMFATAVTAAILNPFAIAGYVLTIQKEWWDKIDPSRNVWLGLEFSAIAVTGSLAMVACGAIELLFASKKEAKAKLVVS